MQYNSKRVWRKHKLEISFGAVALIAALFSHSDIQRSMQGLSEDRARIASNASEQRRLEENAELVKAKAAIAEQRYRDGCTIVVAVNSPNSLATLVEGEPVFDRTSKKPLPAGTVVCDVNGSTAVLASNLNGVPVVTDLAFTGNRDLALALIRKIKGARVYYYTPAK
ncbi:hypothetical protein SAMD00079811_83050 (plasmid) [Scytonema sp. HK-05]|uniref:hypothetical protein n=1 Tax=Scytonema sp. HK-05 TaxID=1137095 RepID=UPI00095B0809|nr:hypothetical protein [Scytonema sp. HK-05]OKH44706.1 hypothetical protein NIES2130_37750 [Scytonema sp. HK-05]BAY50674.1 hypothetical protein SAMD00079811_83050 [Scytonema sp. HK-05]